MLIFSAETFEERDRIIQFYSSCVMKTKQENSDIPHYYYSGNSKPTEISLSLLESQEDRFPYHGKC